MTAKPSSNTARDHYAAIGYVASAWGAFEQVLQRELWELAGIDSVVGACLTANIGISGRFLDAIAALCCYRGADEKMMKPLNKLINASGDLSRQRNRAVHDAWGFSEETDLPYRLEISAAKKLVIGAVDVSPQDLNALAQKMLDHTVKFENSMRAMKRKLASLP